MRQPPPTASPVRPEVTFHTRSLAKHWQREIGASPAGVLVFSPYVTSSIAEETLAQASAAEVHVDFSVDNFARGASSLETVRALIAKGCRVFHVDGLHAKVVVTNEFVSVSSQNLTVGGTRNREAGVVLRAPAMIAQVRSRLAHWIQLRRPVTAKMVDELAARLPEIQKAFKHAQRLASGEDAKIWKERGGGLRELRASLSRAERADTTIPMVVTRRDHYVTLARRRRGQDLTRWTVADRTETLAKRMRYLLIDAETGKLAWPAVNHTQMTQFGTRLNDNRALTFAGRDYWLDFRFTGSVSHDSEPNLEIEARARKEEKSPRIIIATAFSLERLRILEARPLQPDRELGPELTALLTAALRPRPRRLEAKLLDRLLSPFRYTRNRFGDSPKTFFFGRGRVELGLRVIHGKKLLVAERRPVSDGSG
jgi:hypothetical protein